MARRMMVPPGKLRAIFLVYMTLLAIGYAQASENTAINVRVVSPNSSPGLMNDDSVTSVLIVAIQNGTSEGTGTLTKGYSAWRGSFLVHATGTTDFWAYAYNASNAVVWNGLTSDFIVHSNQRNTVTIRMIPLPFENTPDIGMMVPVAGGTFTLRAGGPNMTESTFYMSANLITREQFWSVMGADPSVTSVSRGTSDPVQNVNWYMAITFCNKLSLLEGLTPVYSVSTVANWSSLRFSRIPRSNNLKWDAATINDGANGYRLPTEMQYMWAAMGGMSDGLSGDIVQGINVLGFEKGYAGSTEPAGGQKYIGNYAWYYTNDDISTQPIGTKTSNELGIFDLSGNVMEWEWDWIGIYPTTATIDYQGGASGLYRVAQGGSWDFIASYCTVAGRLIIAPYYQGSITGFRVVRQ
ncbi:MAG: formylglycine-generating enzyme family protein [Spirochaetales bacterium]|nr:formylglycine-generating enzyme family protein [Spirochaetales bacterium]